MEKEHVISDDAMVSIQSAIAKNENWIACNIISYFFEKGDPLFF